MRKLMMGITTYNNINNIENIEKMMNNNNVFLCDDHSRDETFMYLKKKYPDRVIKTKNNNGNPSASRNLLIETFSNQYDYVIFCDGDDFLDYSLAKKSIPLWPVDMIFSDVLTATNIGEYIFTKDRLSEHKGYHHKLPASKCLNMSGGRIYNLKVIKLNDIKYGNFPGQDTVFNYDMADHSKVIYVTDNCFYTRFAIEDSLSTNSNIETLKKRIEALANLGDKLSHISKNVPYEALSLVNKNFEERKELVELYNSTVKFDSSKNYDNIYLDDHFDIIPTEIENRKYEHGLTILCEASFCECSYLDNDVQYIYYTHNKIMDAAAKIKYDNILFMDQSSMVLNSKSYKTAMNSHNKYQKSATIFTYIDTNKKQHSKTIYELLLLNQLPVIFKIEMLRETGIYPNFNQNREYLLSLLLLEDNYSYIHSPEQLILSFSILKRKIEMNSGVLKVLLTEVEHYKTVPPKHLQTNDEAISEYIKMNFSEESYNEIIKKAGEKE